MSNFPAALDCPQKRTRSVPTELAGQATALQVLVKNLNMCGSLSLSATNLCGAKALQNQKPFHDLHSALLVKESGPSPRRVRF